MTGHNALMAKKQTKKADRHKPGRMVRLKELLAQRLDVLVDRNATNITQEVQRAVREYLERQGLWPPPGK